VTNQTDVTAQPRLREPSGAGAVPSMWPTGPGARGPRIPPGSPGGAEGIRRTSLEPDGLQPACVLRALPPPAPGVSARLGGPPSSRSRVAQLLAVTCLGLIPWTIGLAVTLPRSYLVADWPLAWVGFDIILLGCLGTTAWSLWKRRQVAAVASLVTSVLLFCDAWFDVSTAHSGRCLVLSTTTAVFGEIPLGILLGLLSVRLQRASRDAAPRDVASSISLWRAPLSWPGGEPWRPIGRPSQPVERVRANVRAAGERTECR
jgi:hypothetical protein